jgi:methylase of polypeptide subunit release factors
MISINDIDGFDFDNLEIDEDWNFANEREYKIHQIHAYHAKFPAFVTTKAIEYAERQGLEIKSMADIFCGCGTTAFEAKRNKIAFWGCDINPVATLIAKTKSRKYKENKLEQYFDGISRRYQKTPIRNVYPMANDRLKYWYREEQYNNLFRLKEAILSETPFKSVYKDFFLCAFSNILKASSVWFTKAIKPQVDPYKRISDIYALFIKQYKKMFEANSEIKNLGNADNKITTQNFLSNIRNIPKVDMIVTSPPYVTSYEYADLHQLSTLWLDFTDDYKDLRKGTIGSLYHNYNFEDECKNLNTAGAFIVSQLSKNDKGKVKSVAKYFLDMQKVAVKTYDILKPNGMSFFVIGNTKYRNIKINNVRHLAESLSNAGYAEIMVAKRKISKKTLTPYRDGDGKFTSDKRGKKIYAEEFILVGRK